MRRFHSRHKRSSYQRKWVHVSSVWKQELEDPASQLPLYLLALSDLPSVQWGFCLPCLPPRTDVQKTIPLIWICIPVKKQFTNGYLRPAVGPTSALSVSVTSEPLLLHQHSKRGKCLSEPYKGVRVWRTRPCERESQEKQTSPTPNNATQSGVVQFN